MTSASSDSSRDRSRHLQRQYRQGLEAMFGISRILSSGRSQQEMLTEVLELMESEMGLRRGTIMLLSADGRELMTEIAHELDQADRLSVRYQYGEGIVGRVVKTGRPEVIPQVSQEPAFLDRLHRRSQSNDEEMSFFCVPISIGTQVIGVLSADRPYNPTGPTEEIVRAMSVIASMIANDARARRQAAIERQALEAENLRLREELQDRFRPENIIGNSSAMREVYRMIQQVAPSDATVLIRGESGTGKELVAHAIHYSSPRAEQPFIKVNCAALSENLIESELFGHEKGAFTGAIKARQGRIAEADGGTLFLDEIGDFTPATQVKLLRLLQEREYEPVGSNTTVKANVRIISATHRDLEALVETQDFRQDLYYRIFVFPINMPPLRDRKDDITLLADYFVERYAGRMGKDVRRITTAAINMMVMYHWPGNVRELENCIERAVLLSNDGVIHAHHLPPTLQTSDATDTSGTGTLQERVDTFERDIIVDTLKATGGNISAAARQLGTTSRILGYRAKQLDIDYKKYRPGK
jgi:Nif-specific regulatory protein